MALEKKDEAEARPVRSSNIPPKPSRIIIEAIRPAIEEGRFPIKRTLGAEVTIEAHVFADGHDILRAILLHRKGGSETWLESPMNPLGNDLWQGRYPCTEIGWQEFTVEAWVDRFATWRVEFIKKAEAGQDLSNELLEGAELLRQAAARAQGDHADRLLLQAEILSGNEPWDRKWHTAVSDELAHSMSRYDDRAGGHRHEPPLPMAVERERATFSAWYEMFPRSASSEYGKHGTFKDVEARLPYVAGMGFDVLYLPPIHPIGTSFRKGPNNSLTCGPNDPGSPWAIGSPEGGHKSIHPQLGSLEDFDHLVRSAQRLGMEIALDIAFQCSPDHPYVREHPEWFRHRPDGSIKYAENPPKKYQDIYPLDFESEAWQSLWEELRDVFLFWVDHGVKIFRVDNPHTKAFRFWDWVIPEVARREPEAIFLSEAFTRPKLMKRLAKGGFTQSYSYFTWRNTKHELEEYFKELTSDEVAQFMRPNLFANTPDILHEYLQVGGTPAFQARLVLAATLGTNYGIYGPPFEHCVRTPARVGSEEYLDSEKYQIRHWDLNRPESLRDLIARINTIRRENPALRLFQNLQFFNIDNPQIIAYGKATPDLANQIVVAVNLDPYHTQSGWLELPISEWDLGSGPGGTYQMHDLITGERYLWNGPRNYVLLDPTECPAHIFRIQRKIGTEQDFDYYS